MAIADRNITDLRSFQEVTAEPRQIAGLYFYQLLDCLIDIAYKISADFRKRPQLYRDLGDPSVAMALGQLNAKYGTDVNFLSGSERNEIYLPLFGASGTSSASGGDSFSRLRNNIVGAATLFAQSASLGAVPVLRQGILSAHEPFKHYLLGLQGDSVRFIKEIALSDLTEQSCYLLLRNKNLAAVFGVNGIAGGDYPYASDPAEDLFVEQVSAQLPAQVDPSQSYAAPSRERISNLQRTALRGAEAIATAIDFEAAGSTDADVDLLFTKCYLWGAALSSLNSQPSTSQSGMQQLGAPMT